MTEQLSLDIIDEANQDSVPEHLYESLKSPDRTKLWKNNKLNRRKTHSGSPNDRSYHDNIAGNRTDKAVPLSPVNQRKWKKSEMKRRSTVTARKAKINDSENDMKSGIIGLDCFAISCTKVEVRNASDISEKARQHKFTCACMQYLDESTDIVYKLQDHGSFDGGIICHEYPPKGTHMIASPIKEEDPAYFGPTSPPLPVLSKERIQTFAENTKAENIAEVFDFNSSYKDLDDTVIELQAIQGDLKEVKLREVWSDKPGESCCEQKSIEKRRIPVSVLAPMSKYDAVDSNSMVYLLISVFSYLDLSSVLEAGRVNWVWHHASQHAAVWRNVFLKEKNLTPQVLHSLAVVCTSTQHLTISNCNLEDSPSLRTELKNLYNAMSASLKALHLLSNSDSNLLVETAVTHCTNLTRLQVDGKVLDTHLDSISNNLCQLSCLNIGSTRAITPHQYYEFDSVKCLNFNAGGLRVDEIGNIVEWFPNVSNLHVVEGASVHSYHVKQVLGSAEFLVNVTFSDTYITPRALLFILCSCKDLKSLNINYSFPFTTNQNFEERYHSAIKKIVDNPLFSKIVKVIYEGPSKPPRTPVDKVEENS